MKEKDQIKKNDIRYFAFAAYGMIELSKVEVLSVRMDKTAYSEPHRIYNCRRLKVYLGYKDVTPKVIVDYDWQLHSTLEEGQRQIFQLIFSNT